MRKLNWPIWLGLLLSFFAFFSYPFIFVNWATTRDFPWANLLLFALAAGLLLVGVRRAFVVDRARPRRSKIAGVILATLSVAIFGFFIFATFIFKNAASTEIYYRFDHGRLKILLRTYST